MRLPTLSIDQKKLVGSEDAKTKEWLVTNSLGGYASSTVLGINTRKYHGLLVAALRQSGDRTVCLAKLDEEVHIDNRILKFGTNEFYGQFFPKGYQYLQRFSVSPFPTYNYRTNDFELEKTIFMPRGENSIIVFYRATNQTPESVGFRVFPLMTCRHFHSVVDRRKNPLSFNQRDGAKEVHLTFNNPKATVIVKNYGGNFVREANWVERLYYREEHNRGESCTDDCYQPGYFEVVIAPQREHHFAVVATASRVAKAAKQSFERFGTSFQGFRNLFEQELKRRQENLATFYDFHKGVPKSEWLSWAFLATDAFITQQTGNKKSIIAGYFWFESWGRDTFISFPGLMLVTGRYEDAKKVLLDYIGYCKKGLIPNFVQDRLGRPSYNTVDATLWYINAVLQYLKYTGDKIFVYSKLWESLKAIIEKHEKGTDFGIRLDRDGLLTHGPQLTWMDAEFDGKAATPRGGKAV
ncbi:glycogen debranching enzyme N-terminal domain-containing protein, partial [Candidatus Bathyarchaeota archaeon]|nr:glycogen debranching enzyme N-terminal domain-containing protein [Candidatus Bathyarchaeota archaeon]